jgi:hypothetical protein
MLNFSWSSIRSLAWSAERHHGDRYFCHLIPISGNRSILFAMPPDTHISTHLYSSLCFTKRRPLHLPYPRPSTSYSCFRPAFASGLRLGSKSLPPPFRFYVLSTPYRVKAWLWPSSTGISPRSHFLLLHYGISQHRSHIYFYISVTRAGERISALQEERDRDAYFLVGE